jgi:hypothetical protein
MKKLKFDMDTLQVESFDLVSAAAGKDSVRAHELDTSFTCDLVHACGGGEPTHPGSGVEGATCQGLSCGSDPCVCDVPPA